MKDGSTGDITSNGEGIMHASHVAGTMIANDAIPDIEGMAPQASLWDNNWANDSNEMTSQAGQGLLVSNHSYGIDLGGAKMDLDPRPLGAYNGQSRALDDLLYNAEYYLPAYAAGNDRAGGPDASGKNRVYFNTSKKGYDLLYGTTTAKNNVVVAAIEGITAYSGPSDAVMSEFSNWGPTDDYRIKPDISAKGVDVWSVGGTKNNDKAGVLKESGTSMATPSVTGVFALWQQYYKKLYPTKGYMKAATVKALMAISADEAGTADGPDARFGWGVINAQKGAEILRDSKPAVGATIVSELVLNNGQDYEITVDTDGTQPLKAAIAWTDPAGNTTGGDDKDTKTLVNDLDLRIIRPNGQEVLPWVLNKDWTNLYAKRADNDVDPIEVVEYKGSATGVASAGTYTIRVSHKGTLKSGKQNFSLIVSGFADTASNKDAQFEGLSVYPNPTNNVLNISADLASIGNANVEIYDISGKQVYKNSELFYNTNAASVDISSFQTGVYMLKLTTPKLTQTIKVVKK